MSGPTTSGATPRLRAASWLAALVAASALSSPGCEGRRGQEPVEPERQLRASVRRDERVHLEDAEGARRLLAADRVGGDGHVGFLAAMVVLHLAHVELVDMVAAEDGRATTPVDVSGVLHLKSAVSCLDDQTLLLGPGTVPETMFAGFTIIPKVESEIHLASTLRMRNGRLLMTANAPGTAERVASHGFGVDLIDMSEFQAVDGGLTCLSLLLSN